MDGRVSGTGGETGGKGPSPGNDPGTLIPAVLVGRDVEKRELEEGLGRVLDGTGRVFLISGEPGIGKTSLAGHVLAKAGERGMTGLWGRCWEGGGAPAFWPWRQLLRSFVRGCPRHEVERLADECGADLLPLVPELRPAFPDAAPTSDPSRFESEHAKVYMYESVAMFFRHAASRRPLAVLLDDLHEADLSSLHLLRFLAREIHDVPVLVVGTYRPEEPWRDPEVPAILRKVGREALHLELRGLAEEAVPELIVTWGHEAPSRRSAKALHRITDGNPFFLREIVRLLASHGRRDSLEQLDRTGIRIPASLRDVIRQRLEPLSPECRRILSAAAVIGREFDLGWLELAAGLPSREVIGLVSEANSAGVVETVAADFRRYRFVHGLIRETIYEELPLAERVGLHHRIGAIVEELQGSNVELLAELAHHFLEGARGGEDLDKAIQYCVRAAEHALATNAYDEAVSHYEQALQALSRKERIESAERCRILLGLGAARRRAGHVEESRQTFLEVIRTARAEPRPRDLARAALGLGGWGPTPGVCDETLVGLLDEALAALPESDESLRARLLARLSVELYWSPSSRERVEALSEEAVALARRIGKPTDLAYALVRRHFALLHPMRDPRRPEIANEIMDLAITTGSSSLALEGRFLLIADLLADGDVQAADPEIRFLARTAEEIRDPLYRWWAVTLRTTRALMNGRFDEGETLANEALAIGSRIWRRPALMYHASHLFLIRREQGRLEELEPLLRAAVEGQPGFLPFRCLLLFAHYALGRDVETRAELDSLAARNFNDFTPDGLWLHCMTLLSECCSGLGDRERAERLYELLLPFAGRNICAGWGGTCYGSSSRPLGLLAAATGRREAAARHFEDALRMNRRMGAGPWVATVEVDYARLLLSSGVADDHRRARELLDDAAATAEALGMRVLAENAAHRASNGGAPAVRENRFRREEDYWLIVFQGRSFRLRDTKGLGYIARLLQLRNHEVHVADLVAGEAASDPPPETSGHRREPGASIAKPGPAGEVLDAKAKAEYKQRLHDLQTDLDQARAQADLGWAESVQKEIEFIEKELRAAYGLGGRARGAADGAERLRKAVTNRIRDALRRVGKADRAAGEHFETAIQTGTFCSYVPREPVEWEL